MNRCHDLSLKMIPMIVFMNLLSIPPLESRVYIAQVETGNYVPYSTCHYGIYQSTTLGEFNSLWRPRPVLRSLPRSADLTPVETEYRTFWVNTAYLLFDPMQKIPFTKLLELLTIGHLIESHILSTVALSVTQNIIIGIATVKELKRKKIHFYTPVISPVYHHNGMWVPWHPVHAYQSSWLSESREKRLLSTLKYIRSSHPVFDEIDMLLSSCEL